MQRFDAIIVGAGQAGPSLAEKLTNAGKTVAFVERHLFGGTCVNTGCTPTKAMVASAYAAHMARRAAEYGVRVSGPVTVDMAAVKSRKDKIVQQSRGSVEAWVRGMKGITVFEATASFVSANEMKVGDETIAADQIFLNLGARPTVPKMPGVDTVPFLTSTTILNLDILPEHLLVVGGSYVGIEFAQMFRRFGASVTIVERGQRLLSREDEDVSACMKEILEGEGIDVRLNNDCIHLKGSGTDVAIGLECPQEEKAVRGSHILLAVGRSPNTDDLNAAAARLELDKHGFIPVDDELRTNVANIWAIGDCNGRAAFTHTSYNDHEIVAANLLTSERRKVSDRIPAHAVYSDPPLAVIGMTEAEVRKSGRPALIGTRPMTKVSRATEKGESLGFVKVLADAETKMILGAMIFGVGGDEAIHCILTCMYAKQPYTLLTHSVHIHPTVAELIPTVFEEMKPLR